LRICIKDFGILDREADQIYQPVLGVNPVLIIPFLLI
jgi:hypothetical protein